MAELRKYKDAKKMTSNELKEFFERANTNAKSLNKKWQDKFADIITYIKENYSDIHISQVTLERAEQIQRNLMMWRNEIYLNFENETNFIDYLNSVITSIDKRTEYLKKNPINKIMKKNINKQNE